MNTLSYQLLIASSNIGYVLFVLIRSSLRKVQYARLLLMAISFLFFGVIYDIMVNNDIIISPFISPYTFILFIFIQSYILATKFSIAFKSFVDNVPMPSKTFNSLAELVTNVPPNLNPTEDPS